MTLIDKHVLLAVSGGIAAYKAAELARLLRKCGAQVKVVMTPSATQFVAPLTFQALSGHPVATELLDAATENAMGHISLARWADIVLVAPATAHTIAKMAHGFADDLPSALFLAAECPVCIAPAMNQAMWNKAAVQENIQKLIACGVQIIGPESGEQACGETGLGRMAEPSTICDAIDGNGFARQPMLDPCLRGLRVLISAGPTREPLDPVRYLSNRSSGKMGYALAHAALAAGAKVTLVSGPVSLPTPDRADVVHVETAAQMHEAVLSRASGYDVYIGAAAVADYRPALTELGKIKKHDQQIVLALQKTSDILADVAALTVARPFTVGFAAETDDLERYAQTKLVQKNLDMIAANWVGREQGGFDSEQNALHVYWRENPAQFAQQTLPMADKYQVAQQLIRLISERLSVKAKAHESSI